MESKEYNYEKVKCISVIETSGSVEKYFEQKFLSKNMELMVKAIKTMARK